MGSRDDDAKEAIEARAGQVEALSEVIHKEKTSPEYEKLLSKLIDLDSGKVLAEGLDERQCAALREWRRDFLKVKKLPPSFVSRFAKATSQGVHAWAHAKENDCFSEFEPHLKTIVELVQEKANLLGYRDHPYDALLDLYEPEMRVHQLDPLFSRLQLSLTKLLEEIKRSPHQKRFFAS